MARHLLVFIALLAMPPSLSAEPASSDLDRNILNNRLNNLESQAIQRRGREGKTLDLLNRQDDRLAGQALNRLKTASPRNEAIPRLERRLDRSRRPVGISR
ncbi:MAG: hypothetical protein AAF543_13925 [Pseudomonadota bacterium]